MSLQLTKEQLKEVERLAGCFLNPTEIVCVMELDARYVQFFEMKTGPVHEAFNRGRLKNKAEVNTKIIELAKEGSVPAQEMALKIIKDSNSD